MRDDFPRALVEALAKRVGGRCSNPLCGRATSGPGAFPVGVVNVGEAAHITGASPGGPRFDATLSAEERRSAQNGLWLCRSCAKLVDSDPDRYPPDLLRAWKRGAERRAQEGLAGVPDDQPRVAILERTLTGHRNYVWDVVVTPDSTRALSASNDRTVRMWDLATGAPLATLAGHTSIVCSVAVSADGTSVAAGALDGTVRVWGLNTQMEVANLRHRSGDAKVAWMPDGRLAVGTADGAVAIWAASLLDVERDIKPHDGPVLKIVALPDDDRILSVSADRTVKLCRVTSSTVECVMVGHTGGVNSVAAAPQRSIVLSASDDRSVRVWDLESGVCRDTWLGHADVVWRVAVSPDEDFAASGSGDDTVRLWEVGGGRCLDELRHPDCVAAVAFSPDGARLIVGCDDSLVYVYELQRD